MPHPSKSATRFDRPVRPTVRLIGGLAADFLENVDPELKVPDSKHTTSAKRSAAATTASSITMPAVVSSTVATAPLADVEISDVDLLDRVAAHLQKTGIVTFQRLKVNVRHGDVTIAGEVASEFEKQTLLSSLKRLQLSGVRKWIDAMTIVHEVSEVRESLFSQWSGLMATTRVTGWISLTSVVAVIWILANWARSSHAVSTVPVSVQVSYEGHPAIGAFVTLHPVGVSQLPPNVRPCGYVQANGTVKFNTFGSLDGVPAGEYLATVQWNKLIEKDGESTPGPNIVPDRYGLPAISGLKLQIEAGQVLPSALQLTR